MHGRINLKPRYDAIVVVARVVGAATTILLARAGLRVFVVDRSAYGSVGEFIAHHQKQYGYAAV